MLFLQNLPKDVQLFLVIPASYSILAFLFVMIRLFFRRSKKEILKKLTRNGSPRTISLIYIDQKSRGKEAGKTYFKQVITGNLCFVDEVVNESILMSQFIPHIAEEYRLVKGGKDFEIKMVAYIH